MNDEKELSCIPLERIFHCKSLREINFTWTAKFSSSRLLVNSEWSGGRDNKFWNYNFNILQKTNKFQLLKVKEWSVKFPVWKWSHNSIVKAGLSIKLKSFSIKYPFCFSFWKWSPLFVQVNCSIWCNSSQGVSTAFQLQNWTVGRRKSCRVAVVINYILVSFRVNPHYYSGGSAFEHTLKLSQSSIPSAEHVKQSFNHTSRVHKRAFEETSNNPDRVIKCVTERMEEELLTTIRR